jgi:DNA-binding HxlR family transcriptional regulator
MLIQCLKELEKNGLVKRKVYREVPPKVEYSLTGLGKSIVPILNHLHEWGRSYASYLVDRERRGETYKLGMVFRDIDELVEVRA